MWVYIMIDMVAVCGVLDRDARVLPSGRWYDKGVRVLTLEVNAAIEGFCRAGATEILVADGHGAGGIAPPPARRPCPVPAGLREALALGPRR